MRAVMARAGLCVVQLPLRGQRNTQNDFVSTPLQTISFPSGETDCQLFEFLFSSSDPHAQLSLVLALWATRASFYLVVWRYINNEMELVIGLSR